MKIAFVTEALPYLPCRDGFRIYGANLISRLATRHEIFLFSLVGKEDEGHLPWARQYLSSLRLVQRSRRMVTRPFNFLTTYVFGTPIVYRQALHTWLQDVAADCDVLHAEGLFASALVSRKFLKPKVFSLHDSHSLRWKSMSHASDRIVPRLWRQWRAHEAGRFERLVCRHADVCVVVSASDAAALSHQLGSHLSIRIIPNGTDTNYFFPISQEKNPNCLVFHGNLSYPPNVEAIRESEEILAILKQERAQLTFRIVGASPNAVVQAEAEANRYELLSDLPDLRTAVASATVYVCPIRYGSGVKNKLLEAMAMAMPIVAYPEATAGIGCVPGTHVLVANSRQEFAACTLRLLEDASMRERLGNAARLFVQQSFDWETRVKEFEEIYQALVSDPTGKSRCNS